MINMSLLSSTDDEAGALLVGILSSSIISVIGLTGCALLPVFTELLFKGVTVADVLSTMELSSVNPPDEEPL